MTGASQSFDNCIYLFKSSSSNIFFLATQDRVKPSVRMLSYKSQAKSNHTSLEKV